MKRLAGKRNARFLKISGILMFSLISISQIRAEDGPYIRESRLRALLHDIRTKQTKTVRAALAPLPANSALSSLRQAASVLESQPEMSLHYLAKASQQKGAADLSFWISCYQARAYMLASRPEDAIPLLRKLLSHRTLSDLRRQELSSWLLDALLQSGPKYERQYLSSLRRHAAKQQYSSAFDAYYWQAVSLAEKAGHHQEMIFYLEKLAASYPVGQWSGPAFRRLYKLSCQKQKPYIFPRKLLTDLGRHTGVDPGLHTILEAFSWQKMRTKDGQTEVPEPLGRIEFLADARLTESAYREGLQLLRTMSGPLDRKETQQKHELTMMLGSLANRLYKYQEAARMFSVMSRELHARPDKLRAIELLADSLSYGGLKEDASTLYGSVARQTNSKLLRWQHFWNHYSANDMDQAESLLIQGHRRNYVPPRDYLQKQGPEYWKARVLENQGKTKDAINIYEQLLGRHPDDIYSAFITLRHPEIRKTPAAHDQSHKNDALSELWLRKRALSEKYETWPETLISEISDKQVRQMALLYLAGLQEDVRKDLLSLGPSGNSLADLAMISHLGESSDAWHSRYRFARAFLLKKLSGSENWFRITRHQQDYPELWQAYYPFAYRKTLEKISEILDINPFFVLSIMRSESYYQESALSYVGARGLMQIMPYTAVHIARRIGDMNFRSTELMNPELNMAYGSWYLKLLLGLYDQHPALAAAAYNAGPVAVNSWIRRCQGCDFDEFIESIPYRETRRYVKDVIRTLLRYNRIYQKKEKLNLAIQILPEVQLRDDLF
ncbi:MAG: lytic transglycosylase domain-containing protein [Deltaproteobacteria bacterium]|nr:lytic transglycosylase domain-containing protein [Deltaproteobacteria bacterium]